MLLIFAEESAPRLEYIVKLIFEEILKIEVSLTINEAEFLESQHPKINYSDKNFMEGLFLKPNGLLFKKDLSFPEIISVIHRGEKYFFPTSDDSFLPFDALAASFFLITRMEEYFEKERGKYNCYPAEKSILYKFDLLKKPVVNIWARIVAEKIKEIYPQFEVPKPVFNFVSTIDVDNAWAFAHKGFLRNSGAFIKDVFKWKWGKNKIRIKTWFNEKNDPYNNYDFIDKVFSGNGDKVIFFFLLGNYKKYDKNLSHKNEHFRGLIKNISSNYSTGIHPSFNSSREGNEDFVSTEKHRLEKITGHKVLKSRQHFLRLFFPGTYRTLIRSGIAKDFSMGYSSQLGFRAGICTPFNFYDLEKEKETKLKIYPFQVMDVTLREYLKLEVKEAKTEIENLMEEIKKVGGTFISIWHNETLNNLGRWKGYREVFEFMNKRGFDLTNE